jgi:hypothetical protein
MGVWKWVAAAGHNLAAIEEIEHWGAGAVIPLAPFFYWVTTR